MTELILTIFLVILLFPISVILHEISHILALLFVGVWPCRPKIVLFQIPKYGEPWGYVSSENDLWYFYRDTFKNRPRLANLILSISGGLGSAFFIFLIFVPIFYYFGLLVFPYRIALFLTIVYQIIFGFMEVMERKDF